MDDLMKSFPPDTTEVPKAMTPEEQEAFDKGRAAVNQFADIVVPYIDQRADQISANLLELLQGRLDAARSQTEISPILVAREAYGNLLGSIGPAVDSLFVETNNHVADWHEFHEAIGMTSEINDSLRQRIDNRLAGLALTGLKTMQDNADVLKAADDKWRAEFPNLAARQPLGT